MFIRMSSAASWCEYEYKVFQDEGIYGDSGIVWKDLQPPVMVGEKQVFILFKAKYLLRRLPALYAGPIETLGIVHNDLVVPLDDIREEAYADFISLKFSRFLNLPPQHHRSLISLLADAAHSLFAQPENSGLLRLPLHFSARVTTVQQEGERLDDTLARAITPSPGQQRLYNYHLSMARAPKTCPPPMDKEKVSLALEKLRVALEEGTLTLEKE